MNKLTIEQMRKIVECTPDWAISINLNNGMYYDRTEHKKGDTWLMDIRKIIDDHDRTDNVTSISNHISPLTKVIER